MATGPTTLISDVVVPEVFTPYVQQQTEEKSRLVASGAIIRDASLDALLAGGGLTFNVPSFKDLDNEEENYSGDEADDAYTGGSDNSEPKKTGTSTEIGARLSRNQSWSSSDLTSDLAGADPMNSIAARVSGYWARRAQAAFVATMTGIFADNDAAPAGSEHVQGDLSVDISGVAYSAGVTDFSADAFIDTLTTAGDSEEGLGLVMMHSVVYARARKNNLIDYIPDSEGRPIRVFMGRQVIVDDSMPAAGGVYETWVFGQGAVRWGVGSAKVPTETQRKPDAGNGGGQDVLHNRIEWMLHPVGHAYVGTAPNSGPTNAATTNNLAHAASFQRVYPERKQIKIARLVTREA